MNKSLTPGQKSYELEFELKLTSENDEENRPRDIHVCIEFLRIGEIDTIGEKYYAEIRIRSTWIENTEHFTNYDPKVNWNPNIYIENMLLEKAEEISYTTSKFYDMIRVREERLVKGYFWERLELETFPVDTQELSIVVASRRTHSEIDFLSDPETPSFIDYKATRIFVDQQKWNLYKFVSVGHVASYDLPNPRDTLADRNYAIYQNKFTKIHPKFVAMCFVARKPGYYFFNAYFIIFLITILSLTTFSIDCKYPQNRLQTSFTLVLTSASFKWVINRSLPTISYMTSLDKYAIVCIFYLCVICVWHATIGSFWQNGLAARLDFAVLLFFFAVFLVIHLVLALWLYSAYNSIRNLEKMNNSYINDLKKKTTNI